MVAIGTPYYKELDEIERKEFAEFVNDGKLFNVVEELKINALKEANAANFDLSNTVLAELSAVSVRIGVPVPDADRERLYAILAELWAMFVRLKARGVPAKPTMMLTAGTGTPVGVPLESSEKEGDGIPQAGTEELPEPARLAFRQYREAVSALTADGRITAADVKDEDAYACLKGEDVTLPSFDTWTRNLRTARSRLGLQRRKRRPAYDGRSAVPPEHFTTRNGG